MKLAKYLCLLSAFLLILPVAMLAQTANGSISGAVTDPNGSSSRGRRWWLRTCQPDANIPP